MVGVCKYWEIVFEFALDCSANSKKTGSKVPLRFVLWPQSFDWCVSLFQLPLDINTLSEADKRFRLLRRKPKEKIEKEEEIDFKFDRNAYSKYWKKN